MGRAALAKWWTSQIYFSSCSPVKFAFISSGALNDSPVSSYLSHSCLQDLEPRLCFQFRFHQSCREAEGQTLSSPVWSPPHVMLCQGAGRTHVGWDYFNGRISHRPGYILLGLGQEVFTSLLGHISQRQVLFIVPDTEGKGWSHDTAEEEVCYRLTSHRPQIQSERSTLALSPLEDGAKTNQRCHTGVFEAGKIPDWVSSRTKCGCTFSAAANIFDPTLALYPELVLPSFSETLQPPPPSSYLQDPCCPARYQPHLMLMKLPEDMCTCSARISSSFTPAARLRGLEVGRRKTDASGDSLGHPPPTPTPRLLHICTSALCFLPGRPP